MRHVGGEGGQGGRKAFVLPAGPYVFDGTVKAGGDPDGLQLLAHARLGRGRRGTLLGLAWLLRKLEEEAASLVHYQLIT